MMNVMPYPAGQMARYIVDVEGERYLVNAKQLKPGHFEIQAHVVSAEDKGDSEPTEEEREAIQHMIRWLRHSPPKK